MAVAHFAQLLNQFPCDVEQQRPANNLKPWQLKQPNHHQGKDDPQDHRRANTDGNRLFALRCRQSGRGNPDNDSVVGRKDKINNDNLNKRQKIKIFWV